MQKFTRLIIFLFAVEMLLASCSDRLSVSTPKSSLSIETFMLKPSDYEGILYNERTSVSIENITDYANQSSKFEIRTKSGDLEYEIQPLVDEENDTLLYVIKYQKGWDVIASDKRVQPLLATDFESDFDELMKTDGPGMWLGIIAAEMKVVKHLSDEEFKLSKEEQAYNLMFWKSICSPNDLLANHHPQTKTIIPPSTGHYELIDSYTEEIVTDSINHLMSTFWTQHPPYNIYCPLKTNSSTEHALAGCIAIAGAQVLYYFHNALNIPQTAPSQAYCNSHVGDDPLDWDQYNYTSTIWNNMLSDGASAAPLVANVGKLVGMVYGDSSSSASLTSLCDDAFPAYGLTCFQDDYDETRVEDCLRQSQPVVVGAYGSVSHFLGIPIYGDGHAFVIDGYKRHRVKTTKRYRWVWDDANQGIMHPEMDDSLAVSFSSPYIAYFKMNWGGNTYANNVWFTLNGNWNVGDCDYDYQREMLWNFRHPL